MRHKTSDMLGSSLKIRDIKTRTEKKVPLELSKRHFETTILDTENNEGTSYRVTVMKLRDMLAEVSTFGPEQLHIRVSKVAEQLLRLQLQNEPELPPEQIVSLGAL